MAASGVDGAVVIEIEGDSSGFEEELDIVNKQITDFTKQAQRLELVLENAHKTGADTANLETAQFVNLQNTISATADKLRLLEEINEKSQDQGTDVWVNRQIAIANTKASIEELTQKLNSSIPFIEKQIEQQEELQVSLTELYNSGKISAEEYVNKIHEAEGKIESFNARIQELSDAENGQASATSGLNDSISSYGEAAREASEETAKFKNTVSEYSNSLNEHKTRLKEIDEAMNHNKKSYNDIGTAMELSRQRSRELKEITKELEEEYKALTAQASEMKNALKNGDISRSEYDEFNRTLISVKQNLYDVTHQTGEYSNKANEASGSTTTFGDILKANLTSEAIVAGIKKICEEIGNVIEKTKQLVNETMESGDVIDKQSQILGLSRDAYQEWDYILSLNGASISSMTTSTRTLSNAVEKAQSGTKSAVSAFKELGISIESLDKMSREELFENVIYGLQNVSDEQQRNAIANDLLGRSYTQLIPLLNQTSESTQALKQAAHDSGMIMNDEAVNAAVKYKDALTTLQYTLNGIKENLIAQIMPGLAEVSEGITDIATGTEDGAEKIIRGLKYTAESVKSIISETADNAENIINIAIEHLPDIINNHVYDLVSFGGELTTNFIYGISNNLGKLTEAGGLLIKNVVMGVSDILHTIANHTVV